MIKNAGTKFHRECGVSEFRLIAEGVLPKEVYAANAKDFDNVIDKHFKEMWHELSQMERKQPESKVKKSKEEDTE